MKKSFKFLFGGTLIMLFIFAITTTLASEQNLAKKVTTEMLSTDSAVTAGYTVNSSDNAMTMNVAYTFTATTSIDPILVNGMVKAKKEVVEKKIGLVMYGMAKKLTIDEMTAATLKTRTNQASQLIANTRTSAMRVSPAEVMMNTAIMTGTADAFTFTAPTYSAFPSVYACTSSSTATAGLTFCGNEATVNNALNT